jgi:hypothetical protein
MARAGRATFVDVKFWFCSTIYGSIMEVLDFGGEAGFMSYMPTLLLFYLKFPSYDWLFWWRDALLMRAVRSSESTSLNLDVLAIMLLCEC